MNLLLVTENASDAGENEQLSQVSTTDPTAKDVLLESYRDGNERMGNFYVCCFNGVSDISWGHA